MLLDPDNYPDPESFKPTRFLKQPDSMSGTEMVLDHSVPDPSNLVFGFGRRACPGRWLAYDSLWMAFASILSTLEISPIRDENGQPVPPRNGCKGNFITYVVGLRFTAASLALIVWTDTLTNLRAILGLALRDTQTLLRLVLCRIKFNLLCWLSTSSLLKIGVEAVNGADPR